MTTDNNGVSKNKLFKECSLHFAMLIIAISGIRKQDVSLLFVLNKYTHPSFSEETSCSHLLKNAVIYKGHWPRFIK